MAYEWTDTSTIQKYLDGPASTIQIGDEEDGGNFAEDSAEVFENESVFEITTLLSAAWELPLPDDNAHLARMAAKLTAGKIGATRIGAAVGGLPDWSMRYKNETFAQLIRMLVNHKTVDLTGATKRSSVDNARILILAKTRDQSVTNDI